MTDQIREQVSAFLDGELPAGEIGLLVRRMERDPELRRAFSSYVLAGEALQAPGGVTASPGFAARVSAAITAGPGEVTVSAGPARTGRRWSRPAVAAAVAASAAAVAVLLIRPETQVGSGVTALDARVPGPARAFVDLPTYGGSSPTPAQSQRLAGYLVAHSQFAGPIGRRNVWSGVLAADPGIARVAYDVLERP
jgi:sigma-E factor negative regulatory protein RseA